MFSTRCNWPGQESQLAPNIFHYRKDNWFCQAVFLALFRICFPFGFRLPSSLKQGLIWPSSNFKELNYFQVKLVNIPSHCWVTLNYIVERYAINFKDLWEGIAGPQLIAAINHQGRKLNLPSSRYREVYRRSRKLTLAPPPIHIYTFWAKLHVTLRI